MRARSSSSWRQRACASAGDYRPEKIGAKIRDAQLELIPYMFVVGGREMENGQVSVRDRIEGDLGAMSVGGRDREAAAGDRRPDGPPDLRRGRRAGRPWLAERVLNAPPLASGFGGSQLASLPVHDLCYL